MPINAEVLRPYVNNRIFIETGTGKGDGIRAALTCGFGEIWSVDLENSDEVSNQLGGNDSVILHKGQDSREFLRDLMKITFEPCTFWLDAHACGGAGSYEDVPLLGELEIIASHPIKTHTILIDDVRLIGSNHLRLDKTDDNIPMWKLLDTINTINPRYIVHLIHSNQFNFDIIACTPP